MLIRFLTSLKNCRRAQFPLLNTILKSIRRIFFLLAMETEKPTSSQPSDPPPFDPTEPSTPVSFPIKKLEDLESKSYFKSFHFPFNRSSVPLPPNSSSPARPRLLVCHDMAGGYQDDKWVQGGANEDAYAIWHWYLIDVFVYFSHDLVTIPPPCWINTAHRHGVKALGTFIIEWDEGRVIANTLLSTKDSAQMYAERLTELAITLGFDGWLINMEVQLDAGQFPNLKEFVSHLTQTMHASLPDSLVIWYDSVTKDGKLRWQNQLNEYNKPFFDLCDGIFVNYSWEEDYPKLSGAIAGERKFDVYMGIDVFGRGTYGGGQWTTNVALDVLKKDDVSAAIFAPGWVYETKQKPDFQTAQNRWWGLVEKSWGILQNYPKMLPFYSNFDQGHGYHIYIDGLQISANPWNNISCQTFQPLLDGSMDTSENTIQAFVNFKNSSYVGGGNITFQGNLRQNASFTTRLFQGELRLEQPIYISYSVKSDGNSLLGLNLGFSNINGRTSILLAPGHAFPHLHQLKNTFDRVVTPMQNKNSAGMESQATGWIIHETSIDMNDQTLTDIHVVCYKEKNLDLHDLMLEPDKLNKHSTSITAGLTDFNASLGHISIKTSVENMKYPPATSWVVEGQYISWASGPNDTKIVSLKILWSLNGAGDAMFLKYNVYADKSAKSEADDTDGIIRGNLEYLGVAQVQAFYVSNMSVPTGISALKFIIQVCGVDGSSQELVDSPAFLLHVEALPFTSSGGGIK